MNRIFLLGLLGFFSIETSAQSFEDYKRQQQAKFNSYVQTLVSR